MHLSRDEKSILLKWVTSYKTKKGCRWKVCIPDGMGGQIREQGFESEQTALLVASRFYQQKLTNQGIINPISGITFREFAVEWFNNKKFNGSMRIQSLGRYELELRKRLFPYLGNMKLKDLRKNVVWKFIHSLQQEGCSPNQVYYSVMIFKQIIKEAERRDLIPISGLREIDVPKPRAKDPKFLSPKEMEIVIHSLKERPAFHMIAFALLTGMRSGEVVGLKWDSVFQDDYLGSYKGYIWVRRMVEQKTKHLVETTKNGENRKIPIFPQLKDFLPAQGSPDQFVFGGDRPREASHFSRTTKAVLRELGLPELTYHQLRHSACSYWNFIGLPQKAISEMMGHRTGKTTERYSHIKDEMIGEAVLRVIQGGKQYSNNERKERIVSV